MAATHSPKPHRGSPKRRRGRRGTAIATLAIASLGLVAGLAPAAFAQVHDVPDRGGQRQDGPRPPRPELTDEQQACLEEHGVTKPPENEGAERAEPTDEQRETMHAAVEACGIERPAGRGPGHPRLTDEQKACLEDQGVEKPAKAEGAKRVRPTEEQRAAFEAAAEVCGIDLPERPADAPKDQSS